MGVESTPTPPPPLPTIVRPRVNLARPKLDLARLMKSSTSQPRPSRGDTVKTSRFRFAIYKLSSCSTNIPRGLSG